MEDKKYIRIFAFKEDKNIIIKINDLEAKDLFDKKMFTVYQINKDSFYITCSAKDKDKALLKIRKAYLDYYNELKKELRELEDCFKLF
jgi:hypothetical protein